MSGIARTVALALALLLIAPVIAAPPAVAGSIAGDVTNQPELSAARARRNTPWLRPST